MKYVINEELSHQLAMKVREDLYHRKIQHLFSPNSSMEDAPNIHLDQGSVYSYATAATTTNNNHHGFLPHNNMRPLFSSANNPTNAMVSSDVTSPLRITPAHTSVKPVSAVKNTSNTSNSTTHSISTSQSAKTLRTLPALTTNSPHTATANSNSPMLSVSVSSSNSEKILPKSLFAHNKLF
jgi:hypothetical protein